MPHGRSTATEVADGSASARHPVHPAPAPAPAAGALSRSGTGAVPPPAPPTTPEIAAPGLEDLPDPGTTRWVPRRKATVVTAVRSGLITLEEACRRYALSPEEFETWCRRFEQLGVSGLKARCRIPG